MRKKCIDEAMYNHEPPGYDCPFCFLVKCEADLQPGNQPAEVIYYSKLVTAILALGRWPKNPVDILVVPNEHFENLYDLPPEYATPLHQLTRATALALKSVYHCDGISTRQHNEPAGGQDVWHYHVHVTPRFTDDGFYGSSRIEFPETERTVHAKQLRNYIATHIAELF